MIFKTSNFFDCSSSAIFRSVIDFFRCSRISQVFLLAFSLIYNINYLFMYFLLTYCVDLIAFKYGIFVRPHISLPILT